MTTNKDEAKRRLKMVKAAAKKGALAGLFEGGNIMLSHAKRAMLSSGRSGDTYEKYNPRRRHTASAPGEAPASDLGTLVNSGFVEAEGDSVFVGFRTEYADYLETGTSSMRERPFLRPAALATDRDVQKSIERGVKREVQRVTERS